MWQIFSVCRTFQCFNSTEGLLGSFQIMNWVLCLLVNDQQNLLLLSALQWLSERLESLIHDLTKCEIWSQPIPPHNRMMSQWIWPAAHCAAGGASTSRSDSNTHSSFLLVPVTTHNRTIHITRLEIGSSAFWERRPEAAQGSVLSSEALLQRGFQTKIQHIHHWGKEERGDRNQGDRRREEETGEEPRRQEETN